jgi:hypothetical protein
VVLLAVLASACSESGEAPVSEPAFTDERTTVETGKRFATALTSGAWSEARAMLTKGLQPQYSDAALERHYSQMIEYGGGPARVDGYVLFMDSWATRQLRDIGWVYVSLSGEGYAEAVTVVVTDEDGAPRIREIEWGRP